MTSDTAFDPTAPLAGPPEPWQSTSTPSTRSGPPYHMTDMIAAEPSLARRIVERLAPPDSPAARLAAEIRATLEAGDPVILTGCGTSEHAALAAAEILREAALAGSTSRTRSSRPSRRSSCHSRHRPAGWSSGSATKVARPRPTPPSERHGMPAGRRRSSRSAAAPRPAPWPGSSSRPRSSTRAGATPSAI